MSRSSRMSRLYTPSMLLSNRQREMRMRKAKRRQQKPPTYPFLFLMAWVKPYHAAGERCSSCHAEAVYAYEHSVDIARMAQLRSSGIPDSEAIDATWFAALDDQLKGRYRRAQTTYHCLSCAHQLIAHHSGEEAATLVMIPTEIMGHLSILLLNRLASREDQGQPCLAATAARTIEEWRVLFCSQRERPSRSPARKGMCHKVPAAKRLIWLSQERILVICLVATTLRTYE
jgi:hypothetical protein